MKLSSMQHIKFYVTKFGTFHSINKKVIVINTTALVALWNGMFYTFSASLVKIGLKIDF